MRIKIYEDRFLVSEEITGSQYENLATTLEFEFPETINNIPISEFNKYIVFDIDQPDNQDIIKGNKYSIPYDITKLGEVTFYVKLEEKNEIEDMSDKLIWISRGLPISFNKTKEGTTIITTEKLDAFNTAVTILNETTSEAEELIKTVETKLENGEFKGEQGDKGEKGDAGQIKFVVVAELPTENIDESAIYMKSSSNPEEQNTYEEFVYVNGVWESLGIAQVEVDLSEYVKNTDYATGSKAGVSKVSYNYGIYATSAGILYVDRATENAIDKKTDNYHPIVPSNLMYAVKSALNSGILAYDETTETLTITTE